MFSPVQVELGLLSPHVPKVGSKSALGLFSSSSLLAWLGMEWAQTAAPLEVYLRQEEFIEVKSPQ